MKVDKLTNVYEIDNEIKGHVDRYLKGGVSKNITYVSKACQFSSL